MRRMTSAALSIATALLATPALAQNTFDSVEIRTQELAPGVAVLFGAGGNIAVSHGEDATVLIDDQYAPLSEKIEAAIAGLGAQPVKYVVNTHWHGDHTGGNEALGAKGATIFAHHNVRARMATDQQRGERTIAASSKEALPVVTFDQGFRFHLNGDTIDIVFTGGGHTDGDSIVIWREKNIVHTGDLFFNISSYPFIDLDSAGGVDALIASLDLILSMSDDETQIIPGHGPMATKDELNAFRGEVAEAMRRVEALHAQGLNEADTVAAKPLADFEREGGFISQDSFVSALWRSINAR